MSAPVVLDIQARRAARIPDARTVIDSIADGISVLDAQIRSLAFQMLTDERIDAAERNVELLARLLTELRTHVPATKGAA
jgi:hypothetical protein